MQPVPHGYRPRNGHLSSGELRSDMFPGAATGLDRPWSSSSQATARPGRPVAPGRPLATQSSQQPLRVTQWLLEDHRSPARHQLSRISQGLGTNHRVLGNAGSGHSALQPSRHPEPGHEALSPATCIQVTMLLAYATGLGPMLLPHATAEPGRRPGPSETAVPACMAIRSEGDHVRSRDRAGPRPSAVAFTAAHRALGVPSGGRGRTRCAGQARRVRTCRGTPRPGSPGVTGPAWILLAPPSTVPPRYDSEGPLLRRQGRPRCRGDIRRRGRQERRWPPRGWFGGVGRWLGGVRGARGGGHARHRGRGAGGP